MHNLPGFGASSTTQTEWGLKVRRGEIPGLSILTKFGRNPEIDVVDGFEDVWNGGGAYTGFNATAAETVEVSSSGANGEDDTSTGTGARTLRLIGLDASFNEQTEDVILNGLTPVDTVNQYLRIDRAIVLTAGSGATNAGELTIRQKTTTANVFCQLPSGINQTLICCYTVPAGKTAYLLSGFVALAKKGNQSSEVKLLKRSVGGVFTVMQWQAVSSNGSSYMPCANVAPSAGLGAGTDIKVSANTDTNNTGISAQLEFLLVDD